MSFPAGGLLQLVKVMIAMIPIMKNEARR